MSCETPSEAKKLGREVRGFDEKVWNAERERVVFEGTRAFG